MTRKHYEMIAKAIYDETTPHLGSYGGCDSVQALADLARSLSAAFATDNPRFDRERFLKACGL